MTEILTRPHSMESLGWMVEVLAEEYSSRYAITDGETGRRTTYQEFHDRTSQVANALERLGVSRGDRVGLLMHTCTEYLEVVYGAAKLGATVHLVNRRLSDKEMAAQLQDAQVSGVLFSPVFDDSIKTIRPMLDLGGLWWVTTASDAGSATEPSDHLYEDLLGEAATDYTLDDQEPLAEEGWVIIYTSGTTGRPKGVVISQRNAMAADMTTIMYLWNRFQKDLQPVVRGLVTSGLNHIAGLNHSTTPVLATGGEVILLDAFEPVKTLRAIETYRPNYAFAVGVMWEAILAQDLSQYDLSSLQVIGTAVAYHSREMLRKMHEELGAEIYYMFGMTETTTGTITTRRTTDVFERLGTLGKPHGFVQVRIINGEGEEADVDEPGELQYRGPTVFKEYFGNPEATAEAFVDDGWFRSGDVVRVDADGYMYFVDRLKDMIKSGGLNVYAFEVENVLQNHPDIMDAAVVGIPDEKWGEAVTAFVVLDPDSDATADDLRDYMKSEIARYKVPKAFHMVDEIPRNSIGKIRKPVLRDSVTSAD